MSLAVQSNSSSIHQSIHEKAMEIVTRYKRTEAELLEVLEKVQNHQVYLHYGRSSLFQYGVQDLQLSESVVYNLITVMRKMKEVPELKIEIQQGNITLSNARRIVPILNQQNQSEWLKKASELSQRALEKELVKIHPATATPERASYATAERIKLELGLPEKEMMKLRRVQDLVSQSQAKLASLEDTLIAMTEFYLQHKDPLVKAKRIYVKKGLPSPSKIIEPKSELVSIQVDEKPIQTHNKREPIPANILHQVNLRDQRKCTHLNAEGKRCSQTRWTEIHHKTPVAQGGKNSLENLTTLCSTHHQWIHSKHESPTDKFLSPQH